MQPDDFITTDNDDTDGGDAEAGSGTATPQDLELITMHATMEAEHSQARAPVRTVAVPHAASTTMGSSNPSLHGGAMIAGSSDHQVPLLLPAYRYQNEDGLYHPSQPRDVQLEGSDVPHMIIADSFDQMMNMPVGPAIGYDDDATVDYRAMGVANMNYQAPPDTQGGYDVQARGGYDEQGGYAQNGYEQGGYESGYEQGGYEQDEYKQQGGYEQGYDDSDLRMAWDLSVNLN